MATLLPFVLEKLNIKCHYVNYRSLAIHDPDHTIAKTTRVTNHNSINSINAEMVY